MFPLAQHPLLPSPSSPKKERKESKRNLRWMKYRRAKASDRRQWWPLGRAPQTFHKGGGGRIAWVPMKMQISECTSSSAFRGPLSESVGYTLSSPSLPTLYLESVLTFPLPGLGEILSLLFSSPVHSGLGAECLGVTVEDLQPHNLAWLLKGQSPAMGMC